MRKPLVAAGVLMPWAALPPSARSSRKAPSIVCLDNGLYDAAALSGARRHSDGSCHVL